MSVFNCNGMLYTKFILWILLATVMLAAGRDASTNLYPVCNDMEWGYMDRTGKVVVPMMYRQAEPFSEGLGVIGGPGIFEIVGPRGNKIAELQTEAHAVNRVQEDLVLINRLSFNGLEFFDRSGRQAFPLAFEDARGFSCGLAAVKLDNKWGYIDKVGNLAISNRYDLAMPFASDVAHVCLKEKWGMIDKTGKYLVEPRYDKMAEFHTEGLSAVCLAGAWSFVDIHGTVKVPGQFSQARNFSEGMASVTVNGKVGFIDHAGKFVVLPIFTTARDFSDGLAAVEVGGRWGYVNPDGEQVIRPQFKEVMDFQYGLARVQTDAQWGYIDKGGDFVWKDAPTPMARLKFEKSWRSGMDVVYVFSEAASEKERNAYISYYAREAITQFVVYDSNANDCRYIFAVRLSPDNSRGFLATYDTNMELYRMLKDTYFGVTNSTACKPWIEGDIPVFEAEQEKTGGSVNPENKK